MVSTSSFPSGRIPDGAINSYQQMSTSARHELYFAVSPPFLTKLLVLILKKVRHFGQISALWIGTFKRLENT
jgi:hypothetical protein